jgi:hypothetical protein
VEVLEGLSSSTKLSCRVATVKRMTIQRLENVGIAVEDLTAATTFFVELGLKMLGQVPVEGGSCLRSRLADGSGG